MNKPQRANDPAPSGTGDQSWTRNRLLVAVFFIATAALLFLCYLLVRPFLPALAWALALAVVAHPIHRWTKRRISRPGWAAALSVLIVAVMVAAPCYFVGRAILKQVTVSLEAARSGKIQERLKAMVGKNPTLAPLWQWAESQSNGPESKNQLAVTAGKWVTRLLSGSASGAVSLLIAFFLLFYFLRDRDEFLSFVRSLLPLTDDETDQVMGRVRETVFATLYGTLVVAMVQGTLGGLMFWWLGLPAPLLWGLVMGLLSIIPVLGAFVIWIPAALFLAAQGQWGKAAILAVWGTVVIGLIDNLLYPVLVGKRLRLHTVPVFIAIVGGLMVFGASGLVLGPVILALTDAALDLWRCRTARGNSAVTPVH